MDALNDHYHIVCETKTLTMVLTLACHEIVCGESHLLTTDEVRDVGIETIEVDSIDSLIIRIAVSIKRCLTAGDLPVFHRESDRMAAACHQLYAEATAGGCLATRRGACKKDCLNTRRQSDTLSYAGKGFLLHCLADKYHIVGIA